MRTPLLMNHLGTGEFSFDLLHRISTSTRLLWSLIIALCTAFPAISADSPQRPNIIFILADDLGLGHVGAFGQTKIRTPNLDRLAAEGMKLTQFYSGAAVCAPARSTLMTGLHTGHTPVRNNGLDRHLHDMDVTIAEVLKQAGYVTGGFGKWGLGREHTPGVAYKQGFDTWVGQYSQTHAHFHYPYYLMKNGERLPLPENEGRKRERYAPDVIHAEALKFLEVNAKKPFFAYLAYTLPHVELTAPPDDLKRYAGKWPKVAIADPRPGYIGTEDANAEFATMVTHLDSQVGEVMATLKRLGIDDNTLVFFTSDNGPQPGAWRDIFVEFFDGNGPYRGAKGDFYEGGIREPTIVRWPGKIAPGSSSNHMGYFPDVMPTLAEVAGANAYVPNACDGLSLVPTLTGRGVQKEHDYLYWEAPNAKQETMQQAVRFGNWKAVRSGKKPWELYDLKSDIGEEKNVADTNPDVLKRIDAICKEAHSPERVYGPGPGESAKDFVK